MHNWAGDTWDLHTFHLNNELAGYCSVIHALQIAGCTGVYGPYKRTAVIGFGSTGRGAVHALRGMNYQDVTLFTHRPGELVKAPVPGLRHWVYRRLSDGRCEVDLENSETMPMVEALGHFDVIVNCILQDTDRPEMFVTSDELSQLKARTIVVDVSCDEAMGFSFARPTSFSSPSFMVGDQILYYGVDHSPSYLWNSATNAISRALVPHIPAVLAGPEGWMESDTLRKAIEIRDGRILNPKILSFQRRSATWPHEPIKQA
jgi:alanine dehydrogenase